MCNIYICLIDQAWGQDGWMLAKFFFVLFLTETKSKSLIKTQKKKRGHYQAILTEKAWSMKDLLYLQKDKFFSKTGKMGPS